jgi:hypothetical protein
MRKTIITLVVAVASLVPAVVLADGMPPSADKSAPAAQPDKSKVTMADLAADAPDSYTVVKGDTLWGIAGRFLKDPWKWPQIWEMNRDQIKNPHWIYPGNVIKLDKSGANPRLSLEGGASASGDTGPSGGTEAQAQANVIQVQPRIRVETLEAAIPTIPGNAIGPFLTQPLVVEPGALDNAPTVLATEESRIVIGPGDIAYADRVGANDGVNWQVFRPGEAIHDPDTNELLGFEAKYLADARVKRFGNPTTIEIVKSREEINRGDRMVPARETSFPSYVPRAPDKPLKGTIMSVEGGVLELGQYQIVTINRGARDGVEVGYVLASYHRGQIVDRQGNTHSSDLALGGASNSPWAWFPGWLAFKWDSKPVSPVPDSPRQQTEETQKSGAALMDSTIQLPDERNGLIFVFRVFEKMSYALVMKSSKPIYVGDIVQTP